MRVVSLFSGGKDSTYSTYIALQKGWEVKYLVTIAPLRNDSWMFHYPCIELTKLQAKAMGIRQIFMESEGIKEKELEDLKKALNMIKNKIEGVVCGTVASDYQRHRVDMICEEIGLKSFAPLWNKDQEKLLKEILDAGFKVMITAVSCDGLGKEWLGRVLNDEHISELIELSRKYGFNPSGEGGEFETLVIDCPLFKEKIELPSFKIVWDEKTNSGFIILKR